MKFKKKSELVISQIIGWGIGILVVFVVIFIVYRLLTVGAENLFNFGL